jgi:hypothetical protein
VVAKRFLQLSSDPQGRIKSGCGILWYIRNARAAHVTQLIGGHCQQIAVAIAIVKPHVAPRYLQSAARVTQQREPNGGLARPRFPNQAQHLSTTYGERHITNNVDIRSREDNP